MTKVLLSGALTSNQECFPSYFHSKILFFYFISNAARFRGIVRNSQLSDLITIASCLNTPFNKQEFIFYVKGLFLKQYGGRGRRLTQTLQTQFDL